MKKAIITGRYGLIGSALWEFLQEKGFSLYNYPVKDASFFFCFGSPSSNILFNEAKEYQIRETIEGILNTCDFCYKNKIKLIYPSSSVIYAHKTPYSYTKQAVEDIVKAYGIKALGLRIFTGYGYEKNKQGYSSVVWQFIQDIKNNKRPIVYGNGEQKRDFVFYKDIIRTIYENLEKEGIIDIGTGVKTSFNKLIRLINLIMGKNIKPIYKERPKDYVEEMECKNPIKNYTPLSYGIKKIINSS